MKSEHIRFEEMSDLCDDSICTEEEKSSMLDHIDSCPDCRLEFTRLKRSMDYCLEYANVRFPLADISGNALKAFKARKRKKLLFKSMPAIAASILFIIGVSLYDSGIFSGSWGASYSVKGDTPVQNDSEKVIDIIRRHNATITQVNDLYVEGTVPLKDFQKLRRELAFRDVSYRLVTESQRELSSPWSSNIEEIGAGGTENPLYRESTDLVDRAEKRHVVFRVFR